MKVLLYSPVSLSYNGGAELYFKHMALVLTEQFADAVRIICGDYSSQGETLQGNSYQEVHFYRLGQILLPSVSALRTLYQAFVWADVTYFSLGFFGQDILMLVLKVMTRSRVIAAIHAPLLHQDKWHNLSVQLISRWLLPLFDGIHLLSKSYVYLLKKWGVKNVVVIPCGIDLQAFPFHPLGGKCRSALSFGNRKFTVLFVGRLERQKGADILLAIIKGIPKVNFVVVGEGSYRGDFLAMALTCKNAKFLSLIPHAKLPAIYSKANLLLFPSREETSPAVLFEAMAVGIPVLAAPIPEAKEILGNLGYYTKNWEGKEWMENLQDLQKQYAERSQVWENRQRQLVVRAKRFSFERLVTKLRQTLLG